nr:hypothetical protein [Tanacetum cinerariifolium]
IVPTEMELVPEHFQQGSSHDVSVSTEGFEELKRIVGVKKEALHTHTTLGRNQTKVVRSSIPLKEPLLEEEIFAKVDEFTAMTADINSESESDTEDLPFKKITINTDY